MKELIEGIANHKIRRNKMTKIGKASYGYTKKKYWKLKDGESTFRILPPLGELADDGKWSVFYRIHYGYKNSKGQGRVFQSSLVKNNKSKMIEVPDAALERIEKLKVELEKAKVSGNKEVMDKLLSLVGGKKSLYNLDSNHYMNVMDTQGNIGILKLRHKAKLALDATIKSLREKGIDPLSVDNGRFFTFKRSGMALDTTFQVEVAQETLNIQGVGEVKRDLVHVLTPEIINRLGSEAAELNKLFKQLSSEDIDRIVKTSDLLTGKSSAVDEIFDTRNNTTTETEDDSDDYDNEVDVTPTTQATTAQTSAPTVTPTATTQPTPVTAPTATTVPTPATVAPATPNATVVTSPTQTTAQQVSEMSDEDFLKSLGM